VYNGGAAVLKCELNISYPSWKVHALNGNGWTVYNFFGTPAFIHSLSPEIRNRLSWADTQRLLISPSTFQDDGEYECSVYPTVYTIRLFIWGNTLLLYIFTYISGLNMT